MEKDLKVSHPDYCDSCRKKGKWTYLFSENEREFRTCNDHLDAMAEQERERREWDYYHND